MCTNICVYVCIRYMHVCNVYKHIDFTKYCGKPLTSKLFHFLLSYQLGHPPLCDI